MSDFEPEQIGKLIIILGSILVGVGIVVLVLSRLGLFKLPGDIRIEGDHFKFYFPIVSCLVLSAILTLIVWLINHFKK